MKKLSPISYFPCNEAASIKYFYAHYAHGNRADIECSDENRKTTMVFWHAYPLSKQPDLNRQAKKVFLVLFMFFPISWVGNTIAFPGSSQACHVQSTQ